MPGHCYLPNEALLGKRNHTITATSHKSPHLIAALVAGKRRFGRTNRECEAQGFDHKPQERTQPNIVDKRTHSGMQNVHCLDLGFMSAF
jgi:hypothetical protein